MPLFSFKRKIDDLTRLREITRVFFNTGFGLLAEKMRLKPLVPWRDRIRCRFRKCYCHQEDAVALQGVTTLMPPPSALREAFEALGPTFIKLGQMISLREDIIGSSYAQELKKLQEHAAPAPYEEIHAIVQSAFGASPKNLFKEFEEEPFASASLAQAHHATLKTGERVVVKIQRKGVRDTVMADIHILLYLAHLLETHWAAARAFAPVGIVKEFADTIMRELDFTAEGAHADHFRYNFRHNERVHVPHIYWSYTKPGILTMEYMHGIKLKELKKTKRAVDRAAVARLGAEMFFQEVFLDGFFHADPHPGNFVILPPDALALYDFGMMGILNDDARRSLLVAFGALSEKDVYAFTEHLLRLAHIQEDADTDAFKRAAWDLFNRFFYSATDLATYEITQVFYRTVVSGTEYGIRFKSELVLLAKALLTMESVGRIIDPSFDFKDVLARAMERVARRQLSPEIMSKNLKRVSLAYGSFLSELPARTEKLLKKIEQGQVSVKIDTSELRALTEEFDRQNDVRILALVVVALFIGSAIVLRLEEGGSATGILIGRMGMAIAAVCFAWLVALVRRR